MTTSDEWRERLDMGPRITATAQHVKQEPMTPAQRAYSIFRGALSDQTGVPHWDDLPQWIREAFLSVYMRGKEDGAVTTF